MNRVFYTLIFCLLCIDSVVAYEIISNGDLPDPSLTPGVIATSSWNDICNSHLSRNRNVPESEKKQVYEEYGINDSTRKWCDRVATTGKDKGKNAGCEIDHSLALEGGGSNDIHNLWPQPYAGAWNAHMKDKMENKLHALICDHQISDDEVKKLQQEFLSNWIEFYKKYEDK